MKILKLHAENVKRLKAVEIVPDADGNLVLISGRNNQGKSSVLDSIVWALGGTREVPQRPIRDGQDRAEISLDLGDYEPRIRVTRTWTSNDKSYLRVESAEGAKFASPQKMLDELIGRLSFDPLEFSRLGEKERQRVLRSVAEIPIDLDELDRLRAAAYEARRELGRDLKQAEGALAATPEAPEGTPSEEVSAADVAQELADAKAHNQGIESSANRVTSLGRECREIELEITRLQSQLDEQKAKLREKAAERDELASRPVDPISEADIRYRLQTIEDTNANVRTARARQRAKAAVDEARARHEDADAQVKRLDQQRADALGLASFPVPGLGLDEGDVTFEGLPFGQLSSSAQLRISLGIAMALNPKLQVIRITDGSLLDSESMAVIQEMVADKGFQVWIEVVDESGQVGVVIEDGQVKEPV